MNTRISSVAAAMIAAAVLVAGATAPAYAADPTGDATPAAAAAAKVAKDKKYCVKDNLTGSRVAKTVCKTREQWKGEGFDPLAQK